MKICINDNSKLVEIWMTNKEKQNAEIAEQLKPLYRAYKEKKYLVAVFRSGGRDLCDATANLLCYNRKRLAQQEVEAEHGQGMTMSM